VASQGNTIKQQKEQLAQLKVSLKSTREASSLLQHDVDKLQAKRDELEKLLLEKEKLRLEAQHNAVEAARLREQVCRIQLCWQTTYVPLLDVAKTAGNKQIIKQ
jgi:septal ring factor EnvC (AmiA/AmiB activator)